MPGFSGPYFYTSYSDRVNNPIVRWELLDMFYDGQMTIDTSKLPQMCSGVGGATFGTFIDVTAGMSLRNCYIRGCYAGAIMDGDMLGSQYQCIIDNPRLDHIWRVGLEWSNDSRINGGLAGLCGGFPATSNTSDTNWVPLSGGFVATGAEMLVQGMHFWQNRHNLVTTQGNGSFAGNLIEFGNDHPFRLRYGLPKHLRRRS